MNVKRTTVFIAVFFLFLGFSFVAAEAADVKMRVVVVNPSENKEQTKDIKSFLPKEITLADIVDTGGLEIDYDAGQALYFAYKTGVVLQPLETKTFEVVMRDVWMVDDKKVEGFKERIDRVLEAVKDGPYAEKAQAIAEPIFARLDDIAKNQVDPNITRQQHIAKHRENLEALGAIERELEKLEKILVAVGGSPNIELIEESDINLKSPSSKTTWVLVFVVLTFIAILSATFFFTWNRQTKITENIFAREKDASFSEFTKSDEETPEGGGKKE